MADIPVEKKGGMNWLWWVLGILLLVGVIWWIAAAGDEDQVAEETVTPSTTPEVVAEAPGITIGDILGNPDAYIGDTFEEAEVNVVEVPTDRGFWIEDEGQRMFAVIIDQPAEEPKDINPDQTIQIEEGTIRDRTFLPEIPGAPLDQTTENIAEEQPIFLVVNESNINILDAGNPQPGTDQAETLQMVP